MTFTRTDVPPAFTDLGQSIPGLATTMDGAIQLSGIWPAGVPVGSNLVSQFWIADATGPAGVTASNAVCVTAR